MGFTLKGHNSLPFFLELTPFLKGLGEQEIKQEVAKVVSLLRKWLKIFQVYPFTLAEFWLFLQGRQLFLLLAFVFLHSKPRLLRNVL